ncbi:MAG: hypothetical protein Q7R51_01050, partial [bacterium]|nr:hypothetical protein [bacterium]
RYGAESRCDYMSKAIPVVGAIDDAKSDTTKEDCLKSLEKERSTTKADDLEKSISFTAIGLLVFLSHFYFARKQKSS